MVFALALGQAFTLHWKFSALAGAAATFLLILFNHRKNIIEHWGGNNPISPSGD